eukprot:s5809_g4.t1
MLCPIRDFESVGSLRSRISSHPADRTRHFHPSGSSADSFVLLLATAEGVHLPDADDGDALPHNQTRCFSSKARHCCLMWHHIRRANVPTIGRSSAQGAVIAAAPAVQSSPSKNVHGIDCNFANDCTFTVEVKTGSSSNSLVLVRATAEAAAVPKVTAWLPKPKMLLQLWPMPLPTPPPCFHGWIDAEKH